MHEIIEKIRDHFVVKGNPKSYENGVCRYRDSGGNRCAFGVLIPDELYDPRMETLTVESIFSQFRNFGSEINELLPSDLPKEDRLGFLSSCQSLHDSSHLNLHIIHYNKVISSTFCKLEFKDMMDQGLTFIENYYKQFITGN